MIWLGGEYYVIQDISDRSRKLEVVAEADSRLELERYQRDKGYASCEVYKEQGEELYRLICDRRRNAITTDAEDIESARQRQR